MNPFGVRRRRHKEILNLKCRGRWEIYGDVVQIEAEKKSNGRRLTRNLLSRCNLLLQFQ